MSQGNKLSRYFGGSYQSVAAGQQKAVSSLNPKKASAVQTHAP